MAKFAHIPTPFDYQKRDGMNARKTGGVLTNRIRT